MISKIISVHEKFLRRIKQKYSNFKNPKIILIRAIIFIEKGERLVNLLINTLPNFIKSTNRLQKHKTYYKKILFRGNDDGKMNIFANQLHCNIKKHFDKSYKNI